MILKKMEIKDFDTIYHILEKSFPITEFRTYEDEKKLLENENFQILVYRENETDPVQAFVCAWSFPRFRYIEHLAVDGKIRNQGYGEKALREFLESDIRPVVLEVDLPDTEIAQRRIGFYKRIGFAYNPVKYIQPPLRKGNELIELKLMTYPGPTSPGELEYMKGVLYRSVYGYEEEIK